MDNFQKETHVVSVMTNLHKETCAGVRDKKDDRLLPHQFRRPRLTNGRKLIKNSREESSSDKRREIPCRFKFCKNPSCKFWHSLVCQNYKPETGCMYGRKHSFRHVEADETPSTKSKKGCAKGSVARLKESIQLGCVSQDSSPRKFILREPGKLGSRHAVKFSRALGIKLKFGKERVSREELSKSVNLMSAVLARQNLGKDHRRRPCTKKDVPAVQRGIWQKLFTSSRMRTKLRFRLR